MSSPLIDLVEKKFLKAEPPAIRVGDTVDVHCRITEGEKKRIQIFNGVIIARRGRGVNETFMVRRLIEEEVGREGAEPVDLGATRRETMEMDPADDSGLHSVLSSGQD